MERIIAALLILGTLVPQVAAQESQLPDTSGGIRYGVSAMGIFTGQQVPFWMRTNQAGSIPLDGASVSVIGKINREYSLSDKDRLLDWGAGVEGRFNAGNQAAFILTEAYAKARLSIFQLKVGRSRDLTGFVDSSLSSGAFSVSGNALGIPKLEISIPEYWDIPFTGKVLAVKGSFSYGYFGNSELLYQPNGISEVKSYYHQKSLYLRLGKPDWKFKMYGGFNHQVMWGSEKKIFGEKFGLSHWQTFQYAVTGKTYGTLGIPYSKIGNHIGSIDQALEYDFASVKMMAYHQFFYDVGGLYHLNNLKDGLWGLSIQNKSNSDQSIAWNKVVLEFVASKSQGGELDAKASPSGDEDYYNNSLYYYGWSYQKENIGSNFMTNKKYIRKSLPAEPTEYIGNNRVMLLHLAAEGRVKDITLEARCSFSRNYGTYSTSPDGSTTGDRRIIKPPPYFPAVSQFSGYLEASRPLKNGFHLGVAFAVDQGGLLYNSVGGLIKISRIW